MNIKLLILLVTIFQSSYSFSGGDNEHMKTIVDFDYLKENNRPIATSLKTVSALSKAYDYVFNSENTLANYDPIFYSVNVFPLDKGYVVMFFIPTKFGVIIEPWNDFHNYVYIHEEKIKTISNDEAVTLIEESVGRKLQEP